MSKTLNILIDVFGVLGVALLSVPIWHANKYAMLAARLSKIPTQYSDSDIETRRAQVQKNLQTLRDSWKPWKANCLKAGTVLAAGSYLLSLAVKTFG
jgi:hypothetical protein